MLVPLHCSSLVSSDHIPCSPLPTPLASLNQLLHGGLPPNTVTELFGIKSAFKTQFVLTLAVQTALRLDAPVLVLDADGAVHKSRLVQILAACASTSESATAALSRIHIVRLGDWNSFITLLHLLPAVVAQTDAKLVIIDSISTLFRTCDYSAPTKLLEGVSARLHHLAVSRNLVVVVTNIARMDSTNSTVSAMGDSWRHCIGTRIMLQREPNLDADDNVMGTATIVKSILSSPFVQVPFTVNERGLTDLETS